MEHIGEKCCSNRSEDIQKVEPQTLLEESWFFGNLLNNTTSSRTKMSRCHSDPCRSSISKCREGMVDRSDEKSSSSSTKLGRAPSLQVGYVARSLEVNQEKEILDFSEGRKSINVGSSSAQNSLIRAPSLPTCVVKEEEDEEEEDQESEFTLGRLIRQASLNSTEILSSKHTPKNASIPRKHRLRKKEMEGNKEMGQQVQMNPKKMVQRTSNLQPKEAQDDLEALTSKFEKESLKVDDNSKKVSGFPNMGKEKLRRSTSLLDASFYLKKSSGPSIPSWVCTTTDSDKKSAQDMKDQIKFWARAVASNAKAPGVLITNRN